LDRIDLHVHVSSIQYNELKDTAQTQSSDHIRSEVSKAFKIQQERSGFIKNAYMNVQEVEEFCKMNDEAESVLKRAFDKLALSMRGYHKVLKIARTIADLAQSSIITGRHIQEAVMYRSLDQHTKEVRG